MKLEIMETILEKFPKAEAYWISPTGRVVPVDSRHITMIIDNPEGFGLSKEEVDAMYQQENERMGVEGIAREKIIISLIKKGWIRLRKYLRQSRWTINIDKLNKNTMDLLQQWAEQSIKVGFSRYDEVFIDDSKNIIKKLFDLEEISNDVLYSQINESKTQSTIKLIPVQKFV